MENLCLQPTTSTPLINLDSEHGILEISGESYPENSFEFYAPIKKWIREYLPVATARIHVNINLIYLNTSSTRCLIEILDDLDDAFKKGKDIQVTWFYDEENDRAAETAEEFKEDITLPFLITAVKS